MPSMGASFDSDSDFPVSFGQVHPQHPIASTPPATATAPESTPSSSSMQKPTAPADSSVPASSLAVPNSSLSSLSLPASSATASAEAITSDSDSRADTFHHPAHAPFLIDSDDDDDDDDDDDNDDNLDDDGGDDNGDNHHEYYSMDISASSQTASPDGDSDTPSNELLLGTAFCTFMSFAVIQSFFAMVAGSKAMMGDSAAMLVDALTYFFNWIAERRKRRFDERYRLSDTLHLSRSDGDDEQQQQQLQQDPVRARRIRERCKRKMVLQLEIFPPCLSVSTLMIVTGVVMHKSIQILSLDMHRDPSEQLRPNVNMMMAFSIFNLALDGLNVFCFARAKHLLGYSTIVTTNDKTTDTDTSSGSLDDVMERGSLTLSLEAELVSSTPASAGNSTGSPRQQDWRQQKGSAYRQVSGECSEGGGDEAIIREHVASSSSPPVVAAGTNGNGRRNPGDHHHHENHFDSEEELEEPEHANLNMCSAYTHVFADTLRSIAVIVASGVADVVDGVTPEEADAAAAVVVSILVLLSMVPLFHGLVQSVSELRAILSEEESEKMFPEHANATTELN
jgi:Co/Zn/Cd efflux system component